MIHVRRWVERRQLLQPFLVAPERFDDSTEVLPLAAGERLLLLSDGVLDTADDQERLFGVERLHEVLTGNRDSVRLFDEVMQALERFGGRPRDDISLCDIRMFTADERVPAPMIYAERGRPSPLDWSLGFELRGESLKRFNPVPYLVQLLQEIHPLRSRTGSLHSVLSELFSNALEHGVLGLDSRLKRDVEGFADYYRERARRLEALTEGFVRIDLKVEPYAQGGRLMIEVRDSGAGFDVQQVLSRPAQDQGLSGRGVNLVRRLGSDAQWCEGGRGARVEFVW
jgi:anti-sigma regulatory factor (Ser/Thr protein kinase)